MSGGIGDNIMYSRFIKQISQTNHNIIFLIYDNLFWIYEYIYRDCLNVVVVPFCDRGKITKFDYHCNVSYLHFALELVGLQIYLYRLFSRVTKLSCRYITIHQTYNSYQLERKSR